MKWSVWERDEERERETKINSLWSMVWERAHEREREKDIEKRMRGVKEKSEKEKMVEWRRGSVCMIKGAKRIIIKRQGGKIMYGAVLASIHAFYSLGG